MANSHNIFPWRVRKFMKKISYTTKHISYSYLFSSLFLIIAKELNQIINKTVCGLPQSISKFFNIFLKNKRNRSFTAQISRLNTSSLRLLCLVSNVSRPSRKENSNYFCWYCQVCHCFHYEQLNLCQISK